MKNIILTTSLSLLSLHTFAFEPHAFQPNFQLFCTNKKNSLNKVSLAIEKIKEQTTTQNVYTAIFTSLYGPRLQGKEYKIDLFEYPLQAQNESGSILTSNISDGTSISILYMKDIIALDNQQSNGEILQFTCNSGK